MFSTELNQPIQRLYFIANCDKFGSKDMKRCVVNMMKDPLYAEMHITLWFKTSLRILEMVKHSVTEKVSLFCQLFPEIVFGSDIFYDQMIYYDFDLDARLEEVWRVKLPEGWWVIIDETNCLLQGTDAGYEGFSKPRPAFSPIVSTLKPICHKLIFSGTGIDYMLIADCIQSWTMKNVSFMTEEWNNFTIMDGMKVSAYACHVLSLKMPTVSESERKIVAETLASFDLCHGRARFCATLLEMYIEGSSLSSAVTRRFYSRVPVDSFS